MATETTIKVWKCEKCGHIHATQYLAERCCVNKVCEDCGCSLHPMWYTTVCAPCREKRLYEKAKKITYEEYIKRFPGHTIVYGDSCYSDMESLLDSLVPDLDDIPKYVWGACEMRMAVDGDAALEDAEENAYEGAEFDKNGREEFIAFIEAWNDKYSEKYYIEDDETAVLVPEDMVNDYSGENEN